MPTTGDLAPIANPEIEIALGGKIWKCKQLTIGDYADLEAYLANAPIRAGLTAKRTKKVDGKEVEYDKLLNMSDPEIKERSIVTCHAELNRLENVLYIFWLAVRHNNITLAEIKKDIGIKELADLYKITSELSGILGANPF